MSILVAVIVYLLQKAFVAWNTIAEPHPWDIHPDGKRFLLTKEATPEAAESPRRINIVLN